MENEIVSRVHGESDTYAYVLRKISLYCEVCTCTYEYILLVWLGLRIRADSLMAQASETRRLDGGCKTNSPVATRGSAKS